MRDAREKPDGDDDGARPDEEQVRGRIGQAGRRRRGPRRAPSARGFDPARGGFAAAAGAHPALAGATADARVAASELRAAVEDLAEKSIDDDLVGRRRVAGVVRERTRALIARAEDVAVAAMGELAAAASREASREATGGRRFKLPIY